MSRASISSVTIGSPVSRLGLGQQPQALLAEPLERVRRGARLVGAAAEQARAAGRRPVAPRSASGRATRPCTARRSAQKCSPPMRRPSTSITVRSPGLSCAEESLNGLRIGTTCSTPSWPSRPRRATCSRSPIAPITVTSSPREGCARAPQDSIRSMTACTCSSVAVGFITIIMVLSAYSPGEGGPRAAGGSGARPSGPGIADGGWHEATPAERLAKSPGAVGEAYA